MGYGRLKYEAKEVRNVVRGRGQREAMEVSSLRTGKRTLTLWGLAQVRQESVWKGDNHRRSSTPKDNERDEGNEDPSIEVEEVDWQERAVDAKRTLRQCEKECRDLGVNQHRHPIETWGFTSGPRMTRTWSLRSTSASATRARITHTHLCSLVEAPVLEACCSLVVAPQSGRRRSSVVCQSAKSEAWEIEIETSREYRSLW